MVPASIKPYIPQYAPNPGCIFMERGLMPMSKNKKILLMLTKGGISQSDIASSLHVSKRDVSAAAKVVKEYDLTFDAVNAMNADAIEELFFPRQARETSDAYLKPDIEAYVERKKHSRKIPVKLFWMEYCEKAAEEGKLAYAYQSFCVMFNEVAKKMAATRHFVHEPGAKCYIDWCGDTAHLTNKLSGAKTPVYVLVVVLPFSDKFWAEGFCDMKQKSWQDGQMNAFEDFGGVPRMWVPDNAATATDRSASTHVTVINKEYERFADHYGAAIVPARVRKPRDKSVGESSVDLVERWIIGPACEMTFYTLDEFNEFCAQKVHWLNSRPFSAKEGSRDSVFEQEESMHLMPLPAERYEICEWRSPKVAPNYHVKVDYMYYSTPYQLLGKTTEVKLTATKVTIMCDGETVATHPRLVGAKGQYSTNDDHMPPNHAALDDPWSPDRFTSWAKRIGPETSAAIKRVLESRAIVEQTFVSCRNILGLSKTYSAALLERACAQVNAASGLPSYTRLKNTILAMKGADAHKRANGCAPSSAPGERLIDHAKSAGRLRGADAYKRKGGK